MVLFPNAQDKKRHGEMIFTLTPILATPSGKFQNENVSIEWKAQDSGNLPWTLVEVQGLKKDYVLNIVDSYGSLVKDFQVTEDGTTLRYEIKSGYMIDTTFKLLKNGFMSSVLG